MRRAATSALTLLLASGAWAAPAATVELGATAIRQGQAVAVTVRTAADGPLVIQFAGRLWPLYRQKENWQTYLGTDPGTASGRRQITVEAVGADGRVVLATLYVTVMKVKFNRRQLMFDPETSQLLDPKLLIEEGRRVTAALQKLEPQQMWEGQFATPVSGILTSGYGVLSIYQGEVRGWHRGIDLAAPEGTPVHAGNAGIVRLAETLPVSGNAVIIDHGMGVLTSYLHMSAIEVIVNQYVGKGALVGRVGMTGLATGPHLHWGVRVNGVYVDPFPWTGN